MRLRKIVQQFSAPKKNEQGFTLIEAITMIAVISVLGVVLWSGATLAMRAVDNMGSYLDGSSAFLQAENALREKCAAVRFPYWAGRCEVEIDETSASIPYYKGQKDSELRLEFKDHMLWVSIPKKDGDEGERSRLPYGPFGGAEFAVAQNPNRGVYGISVTLRPDKTDEENTVSGQAEAEPDSSLTITAGFGAVPLRNSENEND